MRATIEKGCVVFRHKRKNLGYWKAIEDEDIPFVRTYVNSILTLDDKKRMQILQHRGKWSMEKLSYYAMVWISSEANSRDFKGIEDRGSKLCIDHIVPISYGFDKRICYTLIASKGNLQLICPIENLRKGVNITNEAKDILLSWVQNTT